MALNSPNASKRPRNEAVDSSSASALKATHAEERSPARVELLALDGDGLDDCEDDSSCHSSQASDVVEDFTGSHDAVVYFPGEKKRVGFHTFASTGKVLECLDHDVDDHRVLDRLSHPCFVTLYIVSIDGEADDVGFPAEVNIWGGSYGPEDGVRFCPGIGAPEKLEGFSDCFALCSVSVLRTSSPINSDESDVEEDEEEPNRLIFRFQLHAVNSYGPEDASPEPPKFGYRAFEKACPSDFREHVRKPDIYDYGLCPFC